MLGLLYFFSDYAGPNFRSETYETNAVIQDLQYTPNYPTFIKFYICYYTGKLLTSFVRK